MANDFDLQIKWLNGSQIEIQANDGSSLTGTEKILLIQNGVAKEFTAQDVANLAGGGSSYLVYTANLTQSGTNDIVVTEKENTIGSITEIDNDGTFLYFTFNGINYDPSKVYISGASNQNGGNAVSLMITLANSGQANIIGKVFMQAYSDNGKLGISVEFTNSAGSPTYPSSIFGGTNTFCLPEIRVYQ